MITTVRDGKAIGVRGNPDHPFTRGGLCVKVNGYEKRVYSSDRVLFPLMRTGPKGSGGFRRGVNAGDVVQVFDDRGALEAVAEVSVDATAGVVVAPMGYWPRNSRRRRTVNAINPPAFADYGHAPTFSDTLVEVEKSMSAAE